MDWVSFWMGVSFPIVFLFGYFSHITIRAVGEWFRERKK